MITDLDLFYSLVDVLGAGLPEDAVALLKLLQLWTWEVPPHLETVVQMHRRGKDI